VDTKKKKPGEKRKSKLTKGREGRLCYHQGSEDSETREGEENQGERKKTKRRTNSLTANSKTRTIGSGEGRTWESVRGKVVRRGE